MKSFFWTFIVLFLSVAHVNTGHAQIDKLKKGDHVRIYAPSLSVEEITGDINRITDRGILLYGYSNEILFGNIDQLKVGKYKSQTFRGAFLGGVTGGLIVGLISIGTNDPCPSDEMCFFDLSDGEAFLLGAAVGGAAGLLIGGMVGSTIEGYNWRTIHIEMSEPPVAFQHFSDSSSRLPVLKIRVAL